MERTIADKLEAIRRREHWTDPEMADEIGISRPYWLFIRSGRMKPSLRVARLIRRRFSELSDDIINYLLGDNDHVA